jgi:hypothetical protein
MKMKWEEDADPEDVDDDDVAEFESMRKNLRIFLDSILAIDQEMVVNAIQTLALNTITAYSNGVALKWNEAELGVHMVYIFAEINRCKTHFMLPTIAHVLNSRRKRTVSVLLFFGYGCRKGQTRERARNNADALGGAATCSCTVESVLFP